MKIRSITDGPSARSSNFELLRILAMFFVLVVHADYAALNQPTSAEAIAAPLSTWTRVIIEFIALVSVNIFVLISGWFGIRPTGRGFAKLVFQVAFFSTVTYLAFVAFGKADFTLRLLWRNAVGVWAVDQWFVMSYIILFVISPLLNAYVDKASPRQFGLFLLAFYAVQTFADVVWYPSEFNMGYSALSFVGLYLLARFVRLHGRGLLTLRMAWALILVPCVLDSILGFYGIRAVLPDITQRIIRYSNPLVVAQSLGFLILFARMKPFVSKAVNFVSSGCFAVYLLNMNPWIYIHFKNYVKGLYADYSGVVCLLAIFAFLLVFFAASVLADCLLRQTAWKAVEKAFPRR